MARWIPDSNQQVGPKELLGRRRFDQSSLAGAWGQKTIEGSLDFRVFEDRYSRVSLDRLGRTNGERQVLDYLVVRAEFEGEKRRPPQRFHGWWAIQAKKLLENNRLPLQIIPSPDVGTDLEENVYHSHAQPLKVTESYFVALHLRDLFERHGRFEHTPNSPLKPNWWQRKVLGLIGLLQSLAEKI